MRTTRRERTVCAVLIFLVVLSSLATYIGVVRYQYYDVDQQEIFLPMGKFPLPSLDTNARCDQIQTRIHEITSLSREFDLETTLTMKQTEKCSEISQHEQLQSTECLILWKQKLKKGTITNVERFWGFEGTHFGAITIELGDIRAMFKPCSSQEEDTTTEIISSTIDQILSWGQTSPVVSRRIKVSHLEQYAISEDAKRKFQETAKCAKGEYFEGPIIGWWDDLIPVRTSRKHRKPKILMDIRPDFDANRQTTRLMTKYHAFYWLINIMRHGKDEYISHNGDLVSLDLDRANFESTNLITSESVSFSWCFTCFMDKWVYETLMAVGPTQPPHLRLGSLMREVLNEEDILPVWKENIAKALDTRVAMLLNCIEQCIRIYGEQNVLLNDTISLSPKELVIYFVSHSEYKNLNGRKGPAKVFGEEISGILPIKDN